MKLKLIHKEGWNVLIADDYLFYRTQDERGENEKFYKTDLNESWTISRDEFLTIKFGANWAKFIPSIGSTTDSVVIKKDGTIIICGYQDSYFYFIDRKGYLIREKADIGCDDSIYSFDMDDEENVWYASPTADYIGQYSLKKNLEIYQLGEKYESDPLCCPEDIIIYGEHVYISDMNNNRIIKLHRTTKEWSPYLTFEEPVWEYRIYQDKEIVRLQSGLYEIETE